MDVHVSDEFAFLERWLDRRKEETLEAALCRALEWPGEADPVGRVRREMSDEMAEGNRLLWMAMLLHLRHRSGFTATGWAALREQLREALRHYVPVDSGAGEEETSVWPLLRALCGALVGAEPESPSEAAAMLRVAHVPLVLNFQSEMPNVAAPESFAQLALALESLRNPAVVVVRPQGAEVSEMTKGGSRMRSDTGRRELKQAGDSAERLRELVEGKQRQVEVLSARLAKLDKVAKEEKMWLSGKVMELEEQLRASQDAALLESELEEKREEVLQLRRQVSVDAEGMRALRAKMEAFNAERAEMESALMQRLNEAQGAPAPEKPARQFGGTRWVYLPWFMLLFCAVCVTGLYVWAYLDGDLKTDDGSIPFLSSAINMPPESCVGSLFLSITAYLLLLMVAIRWRLNTDALDAHNLQVLSSSRSYHRLNGVAFLSGAVGCICIIGIGSFQEHNVRLGHLLFGAGFFGFSIFAMLGNVIIDFKLKSHLAIRVVRLVLVIVAFGAFVATVGMYWSLESLPVANARAVLEIALCGFILIYLMTYSKEFAAVEVLFDVRKLSQQDWDRKRAQAEAEDMPLLAHLDGDLF